MLSASFRVRQLPNWRILATLLALAPIGLFFLLDAIYVADQATTLVQEHEVLGGAATPAVSVSGQTFASPPQQVKGGTPLSIIFLMALYMDAKDVFKVGSYLSPAPARLLSLF
jgi:hypothetical protein